MKKCGKIATAAAASTVALALVVVAVFAPAPARADLTFLGLGDWGTDPNGTAQIAAAAGMEAVAARIKPEFVALLGDNFYDSGIHGTAEDARFAETFESVYAGPDLGGIPFFAIAGNHDHLGNVTAQIAYTQLSKRWRYPSPYYSFSRNFTAAAAATKQTAAEEEKAGDEEAEAQQHPEQDKDGQVQRTVDFFFIDTVVLAGQSDAADGTALAGDELPGPMDAEAAAGQLKWLEAGLAASTADYVIVAGHYPVYSVGVHGPTFLLKLQLRPLLEKYNAHYMCGHDHDSEHLDEGKGVNYIVSGAGMSCCYSAKHLNDVPEGSLKFAMVGTNGSAYQPMPFKVLAGFTSFRLGAENMTVDYHAHDGTVLYTTPPIPRRRSK